MLPTNQLNTDCTNTSSDQKSPGCDENPVIVIGGGPAGIRAAECLSAKNIPVIIFNAERWQPYNRVKLTPLLSGDVQVGQVYLEPNLPKDAKVKQYTSHPIVSIDTENKEVIGQFERRFPYSKLIIATGSRAHIPAIPGIELDDVFKFRNFDDVEKLVARSISARRCVVIGGGLLGLEAARGMANRKIETIVVEHETRLMARQLDDGAGALLASQIEALGLTVKTGLSVKKINGTDRVESITLSNGEEIECDTLIVCTGIRANMEIARDAGLAVGRAISVDQYLQTSDPDIYAIGECAEYKGHVYGLVGPGLEQAAITANNISGETESYSGSLPTTKLKVVGSDVFSMGDVEQLAERIDIDTITYENKDKSIYRRLILQKNRLVGAMAIGEWPEINVLQNAIVQRKFIWPWQKLSFQKSGFLFSQKKPQSVTEWPAAATVCNCTGVTRGQIGEAMSQGCVTFESLKKETSCSTVCGSCKPLIHELLAGKPKYEPIEWLKPVLLGSTLALIAALITLLAPGLPSRDSIIPDFTIDMIWTDSYYKQVSGFTLLGLSVIAAILSLRKNIKFLSFGAYSGWRAFHILIGLLAAIILFLHTGFHLGDNLNFWLMISFLALGLTGALTGLLKAGEHRLLKKGMKLNNEAPARITFWLHIITFWPLPVLLALHILTVYFY
ncbi:MAG: FAD-dependent oxidoreductase [Rhizobiales bacterium]|nr:FAD-dependent oxidoreductase [Hyphomicrobiales bacterium]